MVEVSEEGDLVDARPRNATQDRAHHYVILVRPNEESLPPRTLRVFFGAILTSGRVLSHLAFTSLASQRVAVCEQVQRGIISPILLAMLVLERTNNDNSRRGTCATILHRTRCSGGDSGDLTLLERVASIVGLLEPSSTQ